MEILAPNEIELTQGCLDIPVTNWCIEDDSACFEAGWQVEQGIFKSFNDIIYNQLNVDPCSCFLVWPFTALSNFAKKQVWYDVMIKALRELKETGKFTPWVGWMLSDGVSMATKYYNSATGSNIKFKQIVLNDENVIASIKSGSMVSTGIKYWPEYFKAEQWTWIIKNAPWIVGNYWHCINFGKANTTDAEVWMQNKMIENYLDVLKFNIIYVQLNNPRSLFFNSGFSYYL